jgi:hypothetical protein
MNTVLLRISEALRINHRCQLSGTAQNSEEFWATISVTIVLREISFRTDTVAADTRSVTKVSCLNVSSGPSRY